MQPGNVRMWVQHVILDNKRPCIKVQQVTEEKPLWLQGLLEPLHVVHASVGTFGVVRIIISIAISGLQVRVQSVHDLVTLLLQVQGFHLSFPEARAQSLGFLPIQARTGNSGSTGTRSLLRYAVIERTSRYCFRSGQKHLQL